jgi:hypothetical protein
VVVERLLDLGQTEVEAARDDDVLDVLREDVTLGVDERGSYRVAKQRSRGRSTGKGGPATPAIGLRTA